MSCLKPTNQKDDGLPLLCFFFFTCAQVRVEALPLEHDEQRAPSQEHRRTQQVLYHRRHGHPPAPPIGLEERRPHAAAERRGRGRGESVNEDRQHSNTIQSTSENTDHQPCSCETN